MCIQYLLQYSSVVVSAKAIKGCVLLIMLLSVFKEPLDVCDLF